MVIVDLPDYSKVRLSAQLNCGTVGLMHFFSKQVNFPEWADALYGEKGFAWTYQNMFGDPWLRALEFEPLFTPDVLQPELQLPFSQGTTWAMTVGPPAAWGAADGRALHRARPTREPRARGGAGRGRAGAGAGDGEGAARPVSQRSRLP